MTNVMNASDKTKKILKIDKEKTNQSLNELNEINNKVQSLVNTLSTLTVEEEEDKIDVEEEDKDESKPVVSDEVLKDIIQKATDEVWEKLEQNDILETDCSKMHCTKIDLDKNKAEVIEVYGGCCMCNTKKLMAKVIIYN